MARTNEIASAIASTLAALEIESAIADTLAALAADETAERSAPASGAPWHWTTDKIVACLATRNALAAMRGKPCPISARLVSRLAGE
jgi:hypothetical protein